MQLTSMLKFKYRIKFAKFCRFVLFGTIFLLLFLIGFYASPEFSYDFDTYLSYVSDPTVNFARFDTELLFPVLSTILLLITNSPLLATQIIYGIGTLLLSFGIYKIASSLLEGGESIILPTAPLFSILLQLPYICIIGIVPRQSIALGLALISYSILLSQRKLVQHPKKKTFLLALLGLLCATFFHTYTGIFTALTLIILYFPSKFNQFVLITVTIFVLLSLLSFFDFLSIYDVPRIGHSLTARVFRNTGVVRTYYFGISSVIFMFFKPRQSPNSFTYYTPNINIRLAVLTLVTVYICLFIVPDLVRSTYFISCVLITLSSKRLLAFLRATNS